LLARTIELGSNYLYQIQSYNIRNISWALITVLSPAKP